jgi:hypothetical protein
VLKRLVLLSIIVLQIVRLATSSASFGVGDGPGTALNFLSTIALVNQGLLVNLNPVQTLLNVSAHMADTKTPAKPAKNNKQQRSTETTIIFASTPELVKTNISTFAGGGFSGRDVLLIVFMLLFILLRGCGGLVLCRIQHLFSRAREGICAVISQQLLAQQNLR